MKSIIKGSVSVLIAICALAFAPSLGIAETGATAKRETGGSCCGPIVDPDAKYVLSALTIGPGPEAHTKSGILQTAAAFLQMQNVSLALDVTFSTQTLECYRTTFSLAYNMGTAPDILSEDQDILPEYAKEGKILALDTYVKADAWTDDFRDFAPQVWDAVSWNGKIYGIPIEQVVYSVYYRKDVLRALGMSDAEIETMLSPENPDFTPETLFELARQAKDAGLVEWGIMHNPDNSDYWVNSTMIFEGEFVDVSSGNMILDTKALRKNVAFHKRLVDEGLTPKDMTLWGRKMSHRYLVEGKTLFWLGGHSGQWREYQQEAYHESPGKLSEKYLRQNMGIAPFPGIAGPVTPLKVHAYTIVSTSKHPDIAFDVITKAVSPKSMARHSIVSYAGPARTSVADLRSIKNKRYLIKVLEIMQYARIFPTHPALGTYKQIIAEAMSGLEMGRFSVDQAVELMVTKARADIPGVIIK